MLHKLNETSLCVGLPDLHLVLHGQTVWEAAIDSLADERFNMLMVLSKSGEQKK